MILIWFSSISHSQLAIILVAFHMGTTVKFTCTDRLLCSLYVLFCTVLDGFRKKCNCNYDCLRMLPNLSMEAIITHCPIVAIRCCASIFTSEAFLEHFRISINISSCFEAAGDTRRRNHKSVPLGQIRMIRSFGFHNWSDFVIATNLSSLTYLV